MKKICILICAFLLIAQFTYSDQVTTNYNLVIPAVGDKGWISKLSNDIISIDSILNMVSSDSVWTDSGSNVLLQTASYTVGIGTTSPSGKFEISQDSGGLDIYLRTQESSGTASAIRFAVGSGGGGQTNQAAIIRTTVTQANPSSLKGDLSFFVNGGDTSQRVLSMDSHRLTRAFGRLSIDSGLTVSAESSTTGLSEANQVGRIEILSSDGATKCYIPIYVGG